MKILHVGAAQIQAHACDIDGNMSRMLKIIRAASYFKVDVLLFAETCIHAYDFSKDNLVLAEPVGGPITATLSRWARTYGMTIIAGMIEKDGGSLYNSQVVAMPEGEFHVQRKHLITQCEIDGGITAGPWERTIFELAGVKCAILICADIDMKNIHRELMDAGVEFLFIPTAGGGKPEDYAPASSLGSDEGRARYVTDRKQVFLPEAILDEKQAPFPGFAAANALGFDGVGCMHRGQCIIVDKNRLIRAQIAGTNIEDHFEDQFCHARITFA